MREYGIERAVRDARLGPIGGGTDEVMKEILGKQYGPVGVHGQPDRAASAGRADSSHLLTPYPCGPPSSAALLAV